MVEVQVAEFDGPTSSTVEVPDALLNEPFHNDLLYRAVRTYQSNGRAGTANTKTRSEVKSSNRKPWRQKGTGRARHGARSSPLWVGGGTTFGPKPKDHSLDFPKRMKRKALRSALSTRFREGNFKTVDGLDFEKPKTKRGVQLLEDLDLPEKVLIILSEPEDNWRVRKTFDNIPTVGCLSASLLNVYSILKYEGILATEGSLKELSERLLD
ncbi:MAG: 50S ribosomal protein L4 [Candidatus Acetothermia bacterium]